MSVESRAYLIPHFADVAGRPLIPDDFVFKHFETVQIFDFSQKVWFGSRVKIPVSDEKQEQRLFFFREREAIGEILDLMLSEEEVGQ